MTEPPRPPLVGGSAPAQGLVFLTEKRGTTSMSISNTTPLPFQIAPQDQQTSGPETVGRHPVTGATIAVETGSGQAPAQDSRAEFQTHVSPEACELQQQLDRPATALGGRVMAPAPAPSPSVENSRSMLSPSPAPVSGVNNASGHVGGQQSHAKAQVKTNKQVVAAQRPKLAPPGSLLYGRLEDIPFSGIKSASLVKCDGRVMAAVKFRNFRMPFYLSSGKVPKEGVTPGQWYPFFGIGSDGWLNKMPDMGKYHNSATLEKTAKALDGLYGDIRHDPQIAEVEDLNDTAAFLGEFLHATEREEQDDADRAMNRALIGLLEVCEDDAALLTAAKKAAGELLNYNDQMNGASEQQIVDLLLEKFQGDMT